MKLRAKPRPEESHCPYCHDGFAEHERVVSCGGCGTVYHGDCLRDELRTCATLGCEVRPELGHVFNWGDRKGKVQGPTLTCCPEGATKREALLICSACGHLVHIRCRDGGTECCPDETLTPLLGGRPHLGSILTPSTRTWLVVLLLLFGAFLVRLLEFDAKFQEAFFWVAGIFAVLTVGFVFLFRSVRLHMRYRAPADPPVPSTPVPSTWSPWRPKARLVRQEEEPLDEAPIPPKAPVVLHPSKTTGLLKQRLDRTRRADEGC